MAIVIIHGINTYGGGVFELGECLKDLGYDVRFYRYEKRHFWSYWFKGNRKQDGASLLHDQVYEEGCDVICHSNGQLVMQSAIESGAKFGKVIVFSGAGTSDKFTFPPGSVEVVHWFVNIRDKAVLLGSLLPMHPFGRAARRGYAGKYDVRMLNHKYNYATLFSVEHSFWFNREWMPKMVKKVREVFGAV